MSNYKNIIINKVLNSVIEMDSDVFTIADEKQDIQYNNTRVIYNYKMLFCENCCGVNFDINIIGDGYITKCCKCGKESNNK